MQLVPICVPPQRCNPTACVEIMAYWGSNSQPSHPPSHPFSSQGYSWPHCLFIFSWSYFSGSFKWPWCGVLAQSSGPRVLNCHESLWECVLCCSYNTFGAKHKLVQVALKSCRCCHTPGWGETKNAHSVFSVLLFIWVIVCVWEHHCLCGFCPLFYQVSKALFS